MDLVKEIFSILKKVEIYIPKFREIYYEKLYLLKDIDKENKKYTSDDYLFDLVNKKIEYGVAENSNVMSIYELSLMNQHDQFDEFVNKNHWIKNIKDLKQNLYQLVDAKNEAVFAYYPENGYMGWHTNWNAPGIGILFSWSAKGNGYFKSYNDKTKNFEMYQDEVGWNVKAAFQKDQLQGLQTGKSWHCVSTNCERFSIGFLLSDINLLKKFKLKESPNGIWI